MPLQCQYDPIEALRAPSLDEHDVAISKIGLNRRYRFRDFAHMNERDLHSGGFCPANIRLEDLLLPHDDHTRCDPGEAFSQSAIKRALA